MNDRLLRLREVLDATGLGKTKLYDLINSGKFPKQVRLAPNTVRWSEKEVMAWIRLRLDERAVVS